MKTPRQESLPPRRYPAHLVMLSPEQVEAIDHANQGNPLLEPESPALVDLIVRADMLREIPVSRRVPVPIAEVGVHNPAHLDNVATVLAGGSPGWWTKHQMAWMTAATEERLLRREAVLVCYRGEDGGVVMFDSYPALVVARRLQAQGKLDVVLCDVIEAQPSLG